MKLRTPNSPPDKPTMTLPRTTNGSSVMYWPCL